MSEIVNLSSSLRSLNPKISFLVPRQISSSFSQPRRFKFLCFPEKISLVVTERIRAIDAQKQEVDDSPVSVELGPICSESHFDQVMEEAQKLGESVVIVWMAAWCRKCIYLKPTIQLWRENQKQAEVIGGHKTHFVVNEVREMIENDSIT